MNDYTEKKIERRSKRNLGRRRNSRLKKKQGKFNCSSAKFFKAAAFINLHYCDDSQFSSRRWHLKKKYLEKPINNFKPLLACPFGKPHKIAFNVYITL